MSSVAAELLRESRLHGVPDLPPLPAGSRWAVGVGSGSAVLVGAPEGGWTLLETATRRASPLSGPPLAGALLSPPHPHGASGVFVPLEAGPLLLKVDAALGRMTVAQRLPPQRGRPADTRLTAAAMSPDGSQLALGTFDGHLELWVSDGSSRLTRSQVGERPVRALAWSPEADALAVATDAERVQLWDPASEHASPLARHRALQLGWSADGSALALVRADGGLLVLDRGGSLVCERRLAGSVDGLVGGGFTADGRFLFVVGLGGQAAAWQLGGPRGSAAPADPGPRDTWSPPPPTDEQPVRQEVRTVEDPLALEDPPLAAPRTATPPPRRPEPAAPRPAAPPARSDHARLPVPRTPAQIRTAATLEIVAGGVNLLLTWWLASTALSCGWGMVTSVFTLGLCPIGVFAGFLSFVLIPLGLLEVLAGVLVLTDSRNARLFFGWLPWLQLASLLVGGLSSAVFGLAVWVMLREPEARAYMRQRGVQVR